jgi:hypothetical protein
LEHRSPKLEQLVVLPLESMLVLESQELLVELLGC